MIVPPPGFGLMVWQTRTFFFLPLIILVTTLHFFFCAEAGADAAARPAKTSAKTSRDPRARRNTRMRAAKCAAGPLRAQWAVRPMDAVTAD